MKSININEAREQKLSQDWEIISNDWRKDSAKKFLKALDSRMSELELDIETVNNAIKTFWSGDFPKALKLIWKNKIKSSREESDGGSTITYTYTVDGYGTFTETYVHNLSNYKHSIDFEPDNADMSCYELKHLLMSTCTHKGINYGPLVDKANREAYKIKSLYIMNTLFVGFACRELSSVFCVLKRKNKIK